MKYFITSDTHGYYNELVRALDAIGFDINNPEHIFVSLGDLIDRGPDAVKCLQFANSLFSQGRAILIRGNHEDLMEEAICRGYFNANDTHNYTQDTVKQITGIEQDYGALKKMFNNELWNTYIDSTIDYYELGDNIFVHGWIPTRAEVDETLRDRFPNLPIELFPTKEVYDEAWRSGNWEKARWSNGMLMWYRNIKEPNKTIWCGHWHASWGHSNLHDDGKEFLNRIETCYIDPDTGRKEPHVNFDPFIDDGIVAMDACCAISRKVNVKVLEIN